MIADSPICGSRMEQHEIDLDFEFGLTFNVTHAPQYIYQVLESGTLPQNFPAGSYVWVNDVLYTSSYPITGTYVKTTRPLNIESVNHAINL